MAAPPRGNPFDDSAGNPFAADAATSLASREQEVDRVIREYGSPARGGPQGFGSPVGGPAQPPSLQDVPLFDSYSSSGAFATPRSTTATPSVGAGAWASNGKGKGGTPGSAASAFETTAPPAAGRKAAAASDLSRREADLKRREADVARREAALRASGAAPSNKNWPRFWRILHHDIAGDIPAERQGLVRLGYVAWCLIVAGYLWNFVCLTAFWIGGTKKVSLWVMAALVAVAGVPLSFLTWYRSLYFAAKNDGGMRWIWYFLHMLANIVWCAWMFLGLRPDLGGYSAGVFEMITQFDAGGGKGTTFAIMCIINMALVGLGGGLSVVCYGRSMATFRRGPKLPRAAAGV